MCLTIYRVSENDVELVNSFGVYEKLRILFRTLFDETVQRDLSNYMDGMGIEYPSGSEMNGFLDAQVFPFFVRSYDYLSLPVAAPDFEKIWV